MMMLFMIIDYHLLLYAFAEDENKGFSLFCF